MPAKTHHGFEDLTPEERSALASRGATTAHERGTAYEFDSETGRKAGRKGGSVVSQDRQHMADIGRKGAESRKESRRQQKREHQQGGVDVRSDHDPD